MERRNLLLTPSVSQLTINSRATVSVSRPGTSYEVVIRCDNGSSNNATRHGTVIMTSSMVHFRSSHRIAQPSRFARYVWASRGATRRTQVQVQVGHSAEPQVRLGGPGSRVPDVELTRHPEVVPTSPSRDRPLRALGTPQYRATGSLQRLSPQRLSRHQRSPLQSRVPLRPLLCSERSKQPLHPPPSRPPHSFLWHDRDAPRAPTAYPIP